MYTHPSPYAELLTTSSTGADIGSTAPCSTGLASTGVLRLGNKFGSKACNAVPRVCGCGVLEKAAWLAAMLEGGSVGGSGD